MVVEDLRRAENLEQFQDAKAHDENDHAEGANAAKHRTVRVALTEAQAHWLLGKVKPFYKRADS